MTILGIIPARGGSKGIPQKNLVSLAGKPLLSYTCEQALRAKSLTRVIVNTDNEEIARCAKGYRVEVPFLRPKHLSEDETPMLDVLLHALETLQSQEGYQPDIVVLLQPTSPLRQAEQIDEAVQKLVNSDADSVVSVVEVPHQFNPVSLLRLESGSLIPYLNGPQISRRQEKPILYARNGPAILAVRRKILVEQKSLYGNRTLPFVMPLEFSVDIDGPSDLAFAEWILRQ